MNRLDIKFACFLPAVALVGIALFIPSQAMAQGEQPILFSSPDGDDSATNAPSLTPIPPSLPDAAEAIQAPSFNLNAPPGSPSMAAARMPSPQQVSQMEQQQDQKDNWVFLTPQEMLGVPTAKQIMGLSDDDHDTALQRYLKRQENPATNAAVSSFLDTSPSETNATEVSVAVFGSPNSAESSFYSKVLGSAVPNQTPHQNTGGWSFNFGSGSSAPVDSKPSPEQVAQNEAFQKMLEAHGPSPSLPPWLSGNTIGAQPKLVSPAMQPAQDSMIATPQFNPVGASFAPLSANLRLPEGFKPLPAIGQPVLQPRKPEWTPQLPPWMSKVPQPGQIP
jgi:hypothetical protein